MLGAVYDQDRRSRAHGFTGLGQTREHRSVYGREELRAGQSFASPDQCGIGGFQLGAGIVARFGGNGADTDQAFGAFKIAPGLIASGLGRLNGRQSIGLVETSDDLAANHMLSWFYRHCCDQTALLETQTHTVGGRHAAAQFEGGSGGQNRGQNPHQRRCCGIFGYGLPAAEQKQKQCQNKS
jgi:hypothetical protein